MRTDWKGVCPFLFPHSLFQEVHMFRKSSFLFYGPMIVLIAMQVGAGPAWGDQTIGFSLSRGG